jgi:hypothetical protein
MGVEQAHHRRGLRRMTRDQRRIARLGLGAHGGEKQLDHRREGAGSAPFHPLIGHGARLRVLGQRPPAP